MIRTRYLLVGGGLASSQAAKMIASKRSDAGVLIACAEKHVPYDRPPLSKELLRGAKTVEEMAYDPPSFFDEKKIGLALGDPVTALDPGSKTAALASGESVAFEKAFIATGGEPIRLDIPGADLAGVHYLRTLDDALAISDEAHPGRRAAVIGAGFIGMEVAASLTARGVSVTVIEALPQIWPRFVDARLADYIEDHCARRGVTFRKGEKVTELRGRTRVETAVTDSGHEVPCDFVCVGIGIRPRVELARAAGLVVADGIVVDEYLRTSHPDVYAGGDVVSFPDPVFGKRRRVEHWGHAEYCGQVAALNMTGTPQKYDLLSYVWSDLFDLHVEFAGDESERERVLMRGGFGDPSFIVLYLKETRLTAYFAVNTSSHEFPKLQKLIRRKTDLSGRDDALADPAFDLKGLL